MVVLGNVLWSEDDADNVPEGVRDDGIGVLQVEKVNPLRLLVLVVSGPLLDTCWSSRLGEGISCLQRRLQQLSAGGFQRATDAFGVLPGSLGFLGLLECLLHDLLLHLSLLLQFGIQNTSVDVLHHALDNRQFYI